MKIYRLHLAGCRGFSINKAYYKASFTRTQECREWARNVAYNLQIPRNMSNIAEFLAAFKKEEDAIGIFMRFNVPKGIFYTNKNDISIRSIDLSNVEKLLMDVLFDKKHGRHALDLDDKLVVQLISEKVPADHFSIDIGLKILPRI